jgi:LuxR family maltose regulon positive regulatory protein
MERLLIAVADRGGRLDYLGKLLRAFAEEAQRSDGAASQPSSTEPLFEHLSHRELEVLQLIAHGCTDREIAGRLVLALSTVKGHNRNIFGKLQVRRRTEAVARARELGLL